MPCVLPLAPVLRHTVVNSQIPTGGRRRECLPKGQSMVLRGAGGDEGQVTPLVSAFVSPA